MRVFVSMTTIPSRMNTIFPVIQSILQQTLSFDMLTLYIPSKCVRLNSVYTLPEILLSLQCSDQRFQVKTIGRDYGPGTKIIPSMYYHFNDYDDTVLISVDDDVILEKHALEELMLGHLQHPNSLLGFMGVSMTGNYVHAEHISIHVNSVRIDSLGGYRSILFPLQICKKMLGLLHALHIEHMTKLYRPVIDDDHALQQCCIYLNIERRVIRTKFLRKDVSTELQMIPFVNISFVSNEDGVSGKSSGEDLIISSRSGTASFFAKQPMLKD